MNKIYFIEGLPGTGKTSVTEKMSTHFTNKGYPVHCFLEGDPHIPTDFYRIASIPKKVFEDMVTKNNDLAKLAMCIDEFCFMNIDAAPASIQEELLKYDIGDEFNTYFDAQKYITQGLKRIKGCFQNLVKLDGIVIIDSGLLQNPLNEVLYRHGTDDQTKQYILEIIELLKNDGFMCVYLDYGSADTALEFAKKVKGDWWYDKVTEILTLTKSKDHFSRRYQIEKELIACDNLNTTVCKISNEDWSEADLLISKL